MTVASLRCDRRRPLAFIYFIKPNPDTIADTCRASCIKTLARSLALMRPPSPFARSCSGAHSRLYTMLFRLSQLLRQCQSPKSVRAPAAHFRKCFQNISDELNPEYAGGRRCCAAANGGRETERMIESFRLLPILPKLAGDLAKLQARPRPAANFGFIRHATASLIRAAF